MVHRFQYPAINSNITSIGAVIFSRRIAEPTKQWCCQQWCNLQKLTHYTGIIFGSWRQYGRGIWGRSWRSSGMTICLTLKCEGGPGWRALRQLWLQLRCSGLAVSREWTKKRSRSFSFMENSAVAVAEREDTQSRLPLVQHLRQVVLHRAGTPAAPQDETSTPN